jgi:hypothetical protein
MAKRHEEIIDHVMLKWTKDQRGILFKMKQGIAVPYSLCKRCDGKKKPPPVDFGECNGFSDLFGMENAKGMVMPPVPCFIEVKAIGDKLSKDQIIFLNGMKRQRCNCYVAQEQDDHSISLIDWTIRKV